MGSSPPRISSAYCRARSLPELFRLGTRMGRLWQRGPQLGSTPESDERELRCIPHHTRDSGEPTGGEFEGEEDLVRHIAFPADPEPACAFEGASAGVSSRISTRMASPRLSFALQVSATRAHRASMGT